MNESAPILETILTLAAVLSLFGGAIAAQLWARRRRQREEEAPAKEGRGAEVIVPRGG